MQTTKWTRDTCHRWLNSWLGQVPDIYMRPHYVHQHLHNPLVWTICNTEDECSNPCAGETLQIFWLLYGGRIQLKIWIWQFAHQGPSISGFHLTSPCFGRKHLILKRQQVGHFKSKFNKLNIYSYQESVFYPFINFFHCFG